MVFGQQRQRGQAHVAERGHRGRRLAHEREQRLGSQRISAAQDQRDHGLILSDRGPREQGAARYRRRAPRLGS